MSEVNTLWVAGFQNKRIIKPKLVRFMAGDCLVIKYGTLHRGDKNSGSSATYKAFTDVNSGMAPSSNSQLWAREDEGYSLTKPNDDVSI